MKKIALSLTGLLLLAFILLSIGLEEIAKSMLKLNPVFFSMALALLLPSLALKGLKQKLLISAFIGKTKLIENTKIWLVGFFFSTLSPAKSGEALRALYLRKQFGLSLGKGLAAIFLERALDTASLFAIAFLASYQFIGFASTQRIQPSQFTALIGLFSVAFLAAVTVLLKKEFTILAARPFFKTLPEKLKHGIKTGFNDFYKAISLLKAKPRLQLALVALTLASWLLIFTQFYIIAIALSININFISFSAVLPLILLTEVLPISISGLGTREAASVLLLGLLGANAASAVSFSLSMLGFNLIQAVFGFLLFNSMEKPL